MTTKELIDYVKLAKSNADAKNETAKFQNFKDLVMQSFQTSSEKNIGISNISEHIIFAYEPRRADTREA